MEGIPDFLDWELLQDPEAVPISLPHSTGTPKVSEAIDADSEDGAIKHDYFALDSDMRQPRRPTSEVDSEEGGIDSDNPSWVDPDSDSRYANRPGGLMGIAGRGLSCRNSDGFWSDESSDEQRSVADMEKYELGNMEDSVTEVGFEGFELGGLNSAGGDTAIEGSEGAEMRQEQIDVLGTVELVKTRDGSDSSGQMGAGNGSPNNIPPFEKENMGKVWWKMPFDLLKFCVFRVRPIWSISIAAAFVGFIMLGRRLYKMKHKSRSIPLKIAMDDKVSRSIPLKIAMDDKVSRSIPLKIAMDDKKVSQLMVRVARLNEAFSVVKRVPIIWPKLPAGGEVTPWPAMSLR